MGCSRALAESGCFTIFPASIDEHHAYEGGLWTHTEEVIEYSLDLARDFKLARLAFIASAWHDYGKIFDYELRDGIWVKTPFYYRTRHVVESWRTCDDHLKKLKFPSDEREQIGHAILAHHGRKEWGSPVEPQDPLAWAVHLADMMSAMAGETKDAPKV